MKDLENRCPKVLFHKLYVGGGGFGVVFYGHLANYLPKQFVAANRGWRSGYNQLLFEGYEGSTTGNKGIGMYVREFRNDVLRRMGLTLRRRSGHVHKVVLIEKTIARDGRKLAGKRSIAHIDELASALRMKLPGVLIQVARVADLDFREQVKLFSQCTVLVTPQGGVGYGSFFLPDGATLIEIDLPLGGYRQKHNPLGARFDSTSIYRHIPFFQVFHYTIQNFEELKFFSNAEALKAKKSFTSMQTCIYHRVSCPDPPSEVMKILEHARVLVNSSRIATLITQAIFEKSLMNDEYEDSENEPWQISRQFWFRTT